MRDVLVLQHIACESLGLIEHALTAAGFRPRHARSYNGDAIPDQLGDAAGLVIMGGPMSVYEQDQFPFLRSELRLIERTLKDQRPILGTCLGSQLLATALGANVRPGKQKEIGWHPLALSKEAESDVLWCGIPKSFMGFHWHGDIFDLPAGATRLASTELTGNQAFRYGKNAYGFLFHMEVNAAMVREWASNFTEELSRAKIDAAPIVSGIENHLAPLQKIGATVYERWAKSLL